MKGSRRLLECGRAEIAIVAPLPVVWSVVKDVEAWSTWMPSIQSVSRGHPGPFEVGATYRVCQPGLPTSVYTVTSIDNEAEFTWEAKTAATTLVASHAVWPVPGGCGARSVYAASGLLAPVIRSLMGAKIARMLNEELDSLRRRAEYVCQIGCPTGS